MTARSHRPLALAAGLALATGLALGVPSAAGAQDASPEAASEASCAAAHCLAVALSPELSRTFENGGAVTLDELAAGVRVSHVGDEALDVRLIAARYDRGRLVRYGVSPRVTLSPSEDVALEGTEQALDDGLRAVTMRHLRVGGFAHDLLGAEAELAVEGFVGEVPSSYLAGTDPQGLFALEEVAAEKIHESFPGSVGVIALLPDADDARDPEALATRALVVGLAYSRTPPEQEAQG